MNSFPPPLEELLAGGDLRSKGAADQAARALLSGHWSSEDFLRLIEKATPVVRMRAADALEKASRTAPQLIHRSASRLLALLVAQQPKEVRWHLLQMTPRIEWEAPQQHAVLVAVEDAFKDPSAIVQTSALQALADLAGQAKTFEAAFRGQLARALASRLPSLQARARKLAGRDGA